MGSISTAIASGNLNAAPVRYSSPSTVAKAPATLMILEFGGPSAGETAPANTAYAASASSHRLSRLSTTSSSGPKPSFSKQMRVLRARRLSSTSTGVTPCGRPSTSNCAPDGSDDTATRCTDVGLASVAHPQQNATTPSVPMNPAARLHNLFIGRGRCTQSASVPQEPAALPARERRTHLAADGRGLRSGSRSYGGSAHRNDLLE